MIYDRNTFRYNTAKIGDMVDDTVVDEAVNVLPPATMTGVLVQMGEPYSHRPDHQGNWRATYATFAKVCSGVWEYRGHCFRGETEEPFDSPLSPVIE